MTPPTLPRPRRARLFSLSGMLALIELLSALSMARAKDDPAAAIRAARGASNAAIAAHDAAGAIRSFVPDAHILSSGGQLLVGAPAMREAFSQTFADPQFVRFLRTPRRIEVGAQDEAAEQGRWIGEWRSGGRLSGTYLARWRRVDGDWRIVDELYVLLTCEGLPRCRPAASAGRN